MSLFMSLLVEEPNSGQVLGLGTTPAAMEIMTECEITDRLGRQHTLSIPGIT